MNTLEHPSPFDVDAGLCSCRARVVRGEDASGKLVVADVRPVDAATELLTWTSGQPSYLLTYANRQLSLTIRTARDIKRRPAGFKRDAIVLVHDCRLLKGDS